MSLAEVAARDRAGPADGAPDPAHAERPGLRPCRRRRLRPDPAGARTRDDLRAVARAVGRRPPAHGGAGARGPASRRSIAQLDGSDIVYVARVAVPKIITLRVSIGTRFPAAATSLGKVLLAGLPPAELDAVLAEPSRAGVQPRWQPHRAELDAVLREVRARGWALTDEQLAPGIRSVAAPLRDGGGRVIAAMNVTVHAAETSRPDPHRCLPAAAAARGRRRQRRLRPLPIRARRPCRTAGLVGVNPPSAEAGLTVATGARRLADTCPAYGRSSDQGDA